ncbi:MAG: YchF/TatD family DNA exonuclease [Gammaproteobacteria bacterium]|nr:YchF/TatD family DNA exonuclease [Gammaproteobacteria bacterium]MXX94101.1 YchF/TatD family DNA exonuclease [Gammaproteobacteria bacterium]MYF53589.1 YchF/TatD family DNA exonuclease [Gammaproteobacteria bacterium]MYK43441.1 YchF/TatD family DNA exonuclease [Gammaproteobacteria bacterium]
MIDIGANLSDKVFRKDLNDVLTRAKNAQVEQIILTGTDIEHSTLAFDIAQQHPGFLCSTAGVHPHLASTFDITTVHVLQEIAEHKLVVAVGETGLDFFRNLSPKKSQVYAFEAQLDLARNLNLPAFIHDRDTNGLLLEILHNYRDVPGVIHCFTGSTELMKEYLDLGFYIGITGWICDERRGTALRKSVRYIPDDKLLTETDAPYLIPRTIKPLPRSRRNEPSYLPYVLRELALTRNQSLEHITQITTRNAKQLFELD